MKETLKQYLDDFLFLPRFVKLFIFAVIGILVLVCLWQSVSNYRAGQKIEDLEKQNAQLERAAIKAQENARISEKRAIDENIRANNLESQLIPLDKEIQKSDEQIKTQSQKSSDLNGDLQRVRTSSPANTGTAELERRLKARYGKTVGSQ